MPSITINVLKYEKYVFWRISDPDNVAGKYNILADESQTQIDSRFFQAYVDDNWIIIDKKKIVHDKLVLCKANDLVSELHKISAIRPEYDFTDTIDFLNYEEVRELLDNVFSELVEDYSNYKNWSLGELQNQYLEIAYYQNQNECFDAAEYLQNLFERCKNSFLKLFCYKAEKAEKNAFETYGNFTKIDTERRHQIWTNVTADQKTDLPLPPFQIC